MAVYNITSPDGRSFRINAPAGTEKEKLFEYVQSQIALEGGVGSSEGPVDGPRTIEYGTEESYKSENAPWYQDVADVGVGFTSGVSKAAGAIVGLGSYVPGLNKIADPVAAGLQDFGEYIDDSLLSDRQKEINEELNIRIQEVVGSLPADASMDDYIEAMKAGGGEAWEYFKDHKMQVVNLIAASAPYILGGGVITKGLKGGAELAGLEKVSKVLKNPVVGGAVGEASIVGGQVVTDVIDETDSVGNYDVSRLKAAGTIPTTGIISLLGGRVTKGLKGVDIDTALTGKIVSGTNILGSNTSKGLMNTAYKTSVGLVVEGAEETAQSGLEKYWENYGVDKGYDMLSPKLLRGVGEEAVMGGITGAGQGAGVNALSSIRGKYDAQDKLMEDPDITEAQNKLDLENNKDTAEVAQETVVQEQLFESNEEVLKNIISMVENPAANIDIPGVDPREVEGLEPAEKAAYYLAKLKALDPAQEFVSPGSIGGLSNTTTAGTLIEALSNSLNELAPGSVQQIDLELKNEGRRTHAATFPNESKWDSENKKNELLSKRIEIANPTSEIGIAFRAWQDNDEIVVKGKHDTDPGTNTPTEAAVKAFLGQGDLEVGSGSYQQALDDHAQLQEEKARRTEEDQQAIDQNLAALIAKRKEALASGNLEEVLNIENLAAAQIEFTAEWDAAKRDSTTKPAKEEVVKLTKAEQKAKDDDANIQQLNIDNQELSKEEFVRKHPSFAGMWGNPEITKEDYEKTAGDQEGQDLFSAIEDVALENMGDTGYLGIEDGPGKKPKKTKKDKPEKTATGSGVAAPRGEELAEKITEAETKAKKEAADAKATEVSDAKLIALGKKIAQKQANDKANKLSDKKLIALGKKVAQEQKGVKSTELSDAKLIALGKKIAQDQANDTANKLSDKKLIALAEQTETTETDVNPFNEFIDKAGTKPNKKHVRYKKVAEEIGYGFENNDTSEVFGKIYSAIDKSAGNTRINNLMREVQDLIAADAIADPNMRVTQVRRLGKWQQSVIPFLMDMARRDRLDDYRSFSSEKGWVWYNNEIGTAIEEKAGVKLTKKEIRNAGKRVNEAITKYRKRQIELGEISETRETAEEFNERLDNKWLKKILSQDNAVDDTSVMDSSAVAADLDQDPNALETFDVSEPDPINKKGDATWFDDSNTSSLEKLDSTVASASSSQLRDASTDKDLQEYVERNASKTDPKQAARVQQAQMDALVVVDTAHQNKNNKNRLSTLWNQNNLSRGAAVNGQGNTLTELNYSSQPAEVQAGWVVGVQLAIDNRRLDALPEYFESLVYAHSDRIEANNQRLKDTSVTKIKNKLKKSENKNVEKLGTASQTKVAEIQAKRQAVRVQKKQKAEAAVAEKKRKAQERKDNKNAEIKRKNEEKESAKNEKANSGGKPQSKTVPKETSTSTARNERSGANTNKDGQRSTTKVRKKQQALVATGNAEGIVTGNSASADTFNDFFRNMLGAKELKRISKRVFYFETEEQAIAAGYNPEGGSAYVGTVRGPKGERITGKPDIMVFILNKIAEGREGSLFMHEVGGHIGLDNILTTTERRGLESKIDNWYTEDYAKYGNESWYNDSLDDVISSKRPAQSPEHLMARYAIRNASNEAYQDDTGKVPVDTATSEKISFFLEAATDVGVKPSEQTETGRLLNKFKQALVKFLRDIGIFSRIGVTSSLSISAQDIVDLAYGAAKIELESGFRFGRKPPSQRLFDTIEKSFAKEANDPSKWDAEIEADARIKFPKDNKNKYIAPRFLPKDEWRQFQISQGRAEKSFKAGKQSFVAQMLREAAENEGSNKYSKKFSKQQKEIIKKDAAEIDQAVKENYPDSVPQWEVFKGMASLASKGSVFKYDFINRYKDKLPTLQKAQDVIDKSNMLARSLKKMVDDIVVRRRGMKNDRVAMINRMIELGTSRQVWPADLDHLKDKNDTTEYKAVKVNKIFKELMDKKLNAKEQALVMDVFRHGEKTMMMKREIVKLLGLPADVFGITSLEGPYAPLRRTGKHIVVLKSQKLKDAEDELKREDLPSWQRKQTTANITKLKDSSDNFIYRHFLNAGAAKGFRNQQNATGNWATTRYTVKPTVIGEGSSDYGVLQKVFSQLENSGVIPSITNDKATQTLLRTAFKDMLNKMYAESLEETSARQGQQKRQGKGIAGFEQDMLSSFASNGRSEASIISNMRYGQEIAVALGALRKEAETMDDETNDQDASMMKVYNMMAYHYNSMLNKKAKPFTDGIASTVTAWFLTTSVSYHLQNATQTIAVAVPIIAADFGNYTDTMKELTKGYAVAHDMISYDKKIPFIGSKEATWTVNIDLSKAPPELRDLLTNLDQKEILDLGIEQDLAETNAAETGFKTVDTVLKASGSMSHKLYQVPRGVEGYNRIATAVMAYNMAVKNPKVMKILKTNPIDYATKKVQDTQGDFTADGAPAAFKWIMENVPAGKLVIQYKKFPLLMAMNYIRSFNMIMAGSSMQERVIGLRALRNLLGHTAVLSGLRGLPLVANGLMVTSMYLTLFGDDEDKLEPNQTEGALERKIDSMFPDNPEFAKMLYRGVGPSWLGVDLSMKLSHGSVFQLMPFTDFELSESGFKDLGVGFFGASGSAALNLFKGGKFITEGNYYRGIETMMPKGIKDPMEAWRFMTEGYTTNAGTTRVPPGDFKTMELVYKALGIPGKDITNMKWKASEQYQIKKFFTDKQRKMRREYSDASKVNDNKTMVKLSDLWYILQDNKDAVRSFFNDAPSAIPRTDISSLTQAEGNEMRLEDDLQEEAAAGDFKKN